MGMWPFLRKWTTQHTCAHIRKLERNWYMNLPEISSWTCGFCWRNYLSISHRMDPVVQPHVPCWPRYQLYYYVNIGAALPAAGTRVGWTVYRCGQRRRWEIFAELHDRKRGTACEEWESTGVSKDCLAFDDAMNYAFSWTDPFYDTTCHEIREDRTS